MDKKQTVVWDVETLKKIRDKPHLLGHLVGKDKLTELHSEWIHRVWATKENTATQAHRGSYKTTAIVEIGAIWWLLFHPDDRIAIIRKTFTDAAMVVKTIQLMMSMPIIKSLFHYAHGIVPKFETKRDGSLRFNFKSTITPEPNIAGHGLDYSLTGKHYDRIILDDFVTLRDRISRAEREKTKHVLREVFANIIDPGQPVDCIGTPWHKDDAWQLCPIPKKYSVFDTDILTDEQIEHKRKSLTPSLFSANYELLMLSDEESLFKNPIFAKWERFQVGQITVAQLDAAYEGTHYCSLTIMSNRKDGKKQAVGFVFAGNALDWIDFVKEKCNLYRVKIIYNEVNPDKGYIADRLSQKGLVVKRYHEKENKHIKISTVLYEYWEDIIWAEATEPEYLEQILDYREGQEPDDAPDSVASLLRQHYGTKADKDKYNALYKM